MNYKLSTSDLQKQWVETIDSMSTFCKLFDDGNETMSKDIATKLRILFHQSSKSNSLFYQINKSRNFILLSTAYLYTPSNLLSSWELLYMNYSDGLLTYKPMLDGNRGRLFYLNYHDWWNEIIFDDKINVFTRKEIVLLVANKLGGAHVDSIIPEKSANLIKYNSLGWVDSEGNSPNNNPAYCAVRQIAYEVIQSNSINNKKLIQRKRVQDREFEMRFVDNGSRFKWSSTDLQLSDETRTIVNKYRKEKRKLFLYHFDTGTIECIE